MYYCDHNWQDRAKLYGIISWSVLAAQDGVSIDCWWLSIIPTVDTHAFFRLNSIRILSSLNVDGVCIVLVTLFLYGRTKTSRLPCRIFTYFTFASLSGRAQRLSSRQLAPTKSVCPASSFPLQPSWTNVPITPTTNGPRGRGKYPMARRARTNWPPRTHNGLCSKEQHEETSNRSGEYAAHPSAAVRAC